MQSFLSQQGCKNVLKKKTCFKSMQASCIDLTLTRKSLLEWHTQVF